MDKHYAGAASASASGLQQGGYASEVAPKQQPIGCLYEAMNYLRESALMARNTADQLCGSQPEAISKDASSKSASYFGQIEDVAEEIRALSMRVSGDMQRILGKL